MRPRPLEALVACLFAASAVANADSESYGSIEADAQPVVSPSREVSPRLKQRLVSPCEGGGEADPFAAAVGALDARVRAACEIGRPARCRPVSADLAAAFAAACEGEVSRSLSRSARAVRSLERTGALTGAPWLRDAVTDLLTATDDRVAEQHDDLAAATERLCWSSRSPLASAVDRAEERRTGAQAQLASGLASRVLQAFAVASRELGNAARRVESAAPRCRPRACREGELGDTVFRPGAAGAPSLEYVAPDRGLVAEYRLSAFRASGTLRLAYDGIARGRYEGPSVVAGLHVRGSGRFAASVCLDGSGWYRFGGLRDRRGFAPPVVGLPALFPVPLVPQATLLRVGDEILEPGFRIGSLLECTSEHRVTAIEELRLAAGSFTAARIDSTTTCDLDRTEWTTWIVSEIGLARLETRGADVPGVQMLELECFETPETAGRCGAVPAAAPEPGLGAEVVRGLR